MGRWRAASELFLALASGCSERDDGERAVPADLAAARAGRLERENAALAAESAAIDAFGGCDAFAAALAPIANDPSPKRFVHLGDDWLPKGSAKGWLAWNRPAAGREPPVAIDFELPDHPFAVLVDLAAQLAAHGIEFLFVPVPTRLQLYPELVSPELATHPPDAPPLRGMVGATTQFLRKLALQQVESVDLTPEFIAKRFDGDERARLLYLRGNTHWTPRGAELAAERVARRIAEQPWFIRGNLLAGRDFDVARRLTACRGEGNGQAEGAPPESVAVNAVEWRTAPITAEIARASPIVLLGDSFCAMHKELKGSFVDQLVRFTGWPIDVIAPAGGGELACREALARRGDRLAGKRVVIWLLQEPLLPPSGLWKKVALFDGG